MSKSAEHYDPSVYKTTDHIERGDHVSWTENGQPRVFGFVIRRTTLNFLPAFAVREVRAGQRSAGHTVLARNITKECG
jgi:hypothetical protein